MVTFSESEREFPYHAHGAARDLFYCRDSEILLEGPAGTGKTRAVLEYVYFLCLAFPGIRVLFVRKTRASLTESVLVTWEQKVLPDRRCISGTAGPENRRSYTFPRAVSIVKGRRYAGKSHIVLGGMDKATRIMSTEYDIIVAFETNEITENDWEMLTSRNRNFRMPWQQSIADTNPDADTHWLNRRGKKAYGVPLDLVGILPEARQHQTQMTRLLSRHRDNPMLWNKRTGKWTTEGALYMRKLYALTGPRAGRLLRGDWVGAEGQIWEEFDRALHMVYRQQVTDEGRAIQDGHRRDKAGNLKLDWYFASMDWGFRNPGCMQIWGVVGEFERMYRVHELYATGKQLDWWAENLIRYDRKYDIQAVICDPSRDDCIATFNQRLCDYRGRAMSHVAIGADNGREAGWDMVRDGFNPSAALQVHAGPGEEIPRLVPRIYLCWDALDYKDTSLSEAEKPVCTEDEIPGYVWKTTAEGKTVKEEPETGIPDHGCDALRYAAMYSWGRDLTPEDRKPTFEAGSMGQVLDHDNVHFDDDA